MKSPLRPVVVTLVSVGSLSGCTALLGDFQTGSLASTTSDASLGGPGVVVDGGAKGEDGSVVTPEASAAMDAPAFDSAVGSDAASEACVPETDAQLCAELHENCDGIVAIDACGTSRVVTSCGTCASPQTCGAQTANVCGCASETDTAFCARLGKNCGTVSADDNCGVPRTVTSCGTPCTSPQTCGATVANVCGDAICSPETDAEFCTQYGKNCGSFTNLDNCGTSRTASCGSSCSGGDTCGAVTPNVCGCVPESNASFCASLGYTCGTQSGTDNCGTPRANVACGSCANENVCSAGTCSCNGGAACANGATCCGTTGCENLGSDPNNCGTCGHVCMPAGNAWTCASGSCQCNTSAYAQCNGACVTLNESPNCGGCGMTCGAGQQCCLTDITMPWACSPAGSGLECF